jgi:hypothetical protein
MNTALEIIDSMSKNNEILTHSLSFYKMRLAEKVAGIVKVSSKLCDKCENKLDEITPKFGTPLSL